MAIIGIDFGNYNTFACYISDFDIDTKLGGDVHDLITSNLSDGIPSVFFCEDNIGILCGESAVRNRARPVKNRIRYLKRGIGKTIFVDGAPLKYKGEQMTYDRAITEVIQHCVRRANEQMYKRWQITTNVISLAYPVTFSCAHRKQLIDLAQKATLEDGRHIEVYGTIKEPAAAALDYLACFAKKTEDTTVLVYDLGGGTFDLALVSAYPSGRKNKNGETYYYDILDTDGVENLGGNEFDNVMYSIIQKKCTEKKIRLDPNRQYFIREKAEKMKIELTTDTETYCDEMGSDGLMEQIEVTREEFEAESKKLLMDTINAAKRMVDKHAQQKPEMILLTGGASQMPMVKEAIERVLPEYKDKVFIFRPSHAIAYGAARYAISEQFDEISFDNPGTTVQQHLSWDIGVRYVEEENHEIKYIETVLNAGASTPCETEFIKAKKACSGRYTDFCVYESRVKQPDRHKIDKDYRQIMAVKLDYGKVVPDGTACEYRLVVDKMGILTIEARDPNKPGKPPVSNYCTLKLE